MKKLINKFFSYQGIRFLFVGCLNTVFGYCLYSLLLAFNMNYLLANTVGNVFAILHSYLWNRFFTFKSKEKAINEIKRFTLVYLISYVLGMCTLYLFERIINNPYISGFINIFMVAIISYFGHKYYSFKSKKE